MGTRFTKTNQNKNHRFFAVGSVFLDLSERNDFSKSSSFYREEDPQEINQPFFGSQT
jgi:hypothetical protein